MNPFRRRKIPHPDFPAQNYYTHGDVFNPGAENLALEFNILKPVQGMAGISVRRPLRVTQPQQLYQSIALPVTPLLAGIQAGSYTLDPLTGDPNSDASEQ